MIVAERKPFDEIYSMIQPFETVLLAGCGGCVTVCLTGGEQAVSVLAGELRLKDQLEGRQRTITERTITRQCDAEYVQELAQDARNANAVLSMACGVGVNYMTEILDDSIVLPAMNTMFMGANIQQGEWSERCAGCGNCMLDMTAGVCPIARCSKTLMNGPCGGTQDGKCEINPDIDCAWTMIVERMDRLGRLSELAEVTPPRDWSTSRDGGPRQMTARSVLEETGDAEKG